MVIKMAQISNDDDDDDEDDCFSCQNFVVTLESDTWKEIAEKAKSMQSQMKKIS